MISARWVVFALLVASWVGCGGSDEVVVTGELYHKNELYKPQPGEQVMIVFGEEQNGQVTGNVIPTRLKQDGSFEITGPNNTGIRPGKYRVGVSSMPEVPVPGAPMEDKFQGAYEVTKSPVTVEVSSSNRHIKVELP